jgi:hypothetical protein
MVLDLENRRKYQREYHRNYYKKHRTKIISYIVANQKKKRVPKVPKPKKKECTKSKAYT